MLAVKIGLIAGARVILTSSSDKKLEEVRKSTNVDTINYVKVANWDEEARRLTGGRGVDLVENGEFHACSNLECYC